MADFKDFNSLVKAIERKAKKSLNNNVKPIVIEEINTRIDTEVYGVYAPVEYKRLPRRFKAKKNYFATFSGDITDSFKMSVEHRAMSSEGKNLSKLVILGQQGAKAYGGSDVALYNDDWIARTKMRYRNKGKPLDEVPYYEPRNYIGVARQVLSFDRNRKRIVSEFEKGMK